MMKLRWANQRWNGRLGIAVVLCAGLPFLTGIAAAKDWDTKFEQAWGCSSLFSPYPIKVSNGGDSATALCMGEGKKGRKPMTRSEAFELCREQFNASTLFIRWTSKGWNCRYHGR
jgi:hypothetical protein